MVTRQQWKIHRALQSCLTALRWLLQWLLPLPHLVFPWPRDETSVPMRLLTLHLNGQPFIPLGDSQMGLSWDWDLLSWCPGSLRPAVFDFCGHGVSD